MFPNNLLDTRGAAQTSNYHVEDVGNFRFHGLDFRNLDRWPGHWDDPLDGSKKAYGTHQLGLLAANLTTSKVNVLCLEGWPFADPAVTGIGIGDADKLWAYSYEVRTTIAAMISGYPCFFTAGDRHAAGIIRAGTGGNPWGISGILASAVSMHDLPLADGELYAIQHGFKASHDDPNTTNRIFGVVTYAFNGSHTATITSDCIDATTGLTCVSGPYVNTFTL